MKLRSLFLSGLGGVAFFLAWFVWLPSTMGMPIYWQGGALAALFGAWFGVMVYIKHGIESSRKRE